MARKAGLSNSAVRSVLKESMSKDHVRIIEKLVKPQYDDDLAEQLKMKATAVRTLLNELHANNLVKYDRSKNKRTGWYTYMWMRREDQLNKHIKGYLETKLSELNQRLEGESESVSFTCSCDRVPFDHAMECDFVCPKCEEKYEEFSNAEIVDELNTEAERVNTLLSKT